MFISQGRKRWHSRDSFFILFMYILQILQLTDTHYLNCLADYELTPNRSQVVCGFLL